jgi:hypothetical protein
MPSVEADLVALAQEYAGRWVALDPEDGAVLASGESAKDVFEAAKAEGVELPLVLYVRDDYGQLAPWHAETTKAPASSVRPSQAQRFRTGRKSGCPWSK